MSENTRPTISEKEYPHFIDQEIIADLDIGKHKELVFRFPPEPNGHMHIGHAKALCLNFGYGQDNPNAKCNLRFDDTNPEKESTEYVQAIQKDIKWLGFNFDGNLFFGSDYFEQLYIWATELIEKGLAYVDEQTPEEMKAQRGNLKEPGTNSPFRDRSLEENLNRFSEMRDGKHPDGSMVLRAKIDMASPNMNMRDPAMYRVRHVHHHNTGDKWCIYPMYDFQHPLSDAIEGITHSLCSLEYEDHRPLYNWFVDNCSVPCKPRQIEFARLNLNYLVMSKRKLIQLVDEKHVSGWDDPRMPTLSGLRRRGVTAKSIKDFMDYISIGKKNTIIDYSLFEKFVRDDLNTFTKRVMGVLDPIKVNITNWDQGDLEIDAPFHPKDESFGARKVTLSDTLYVERSDFMKEPPSPKKWYRLGPDRRVRLRYGCIIHCDTFETDSEGNVTEINCHYIPDSFHGNTPEGEKKAKGIIHWVNANDAKDVEVRMYDRLFNVENPDGGDKDFLEYINEDSLKTITAKVEPYIATIEACVQVQFERMGYFVADEYDSKPGAPAFNQIVALKDGWAKAQKKD